MSNYNGTTSIKDLYTLSNPNKMWMFSKTYCQVLKLLVLMF